MKSARRSAKPTARTADLPFQSEGRMKKDPREKWSPLFLKMWRVQQRVAVRLRREFRRSRQEAARVAREAARIVGDLIADMKKRLHRMANGMRLASVFREQLARRFAPPRQEEAVAPVRLGLTPGTGDGLRSTVARRGVQIARNFVYGKLNWLLRIRRSLELGICPLCHEHALSWGICPLYWIAERRRRMGLLDEEELYALNGDPSQYYSDLLASARSDRVRFSTLVGLVLQAVGTPLVLRPLSGVSFVRRSLSAGGWVTRIEYFVFGTRVLDRALGKPLRLIEAERVSALESVDEFLARMQAAKRAKARRMALMRQQAEERRRIEESRRLAEMRAREAESSLRSQAAPTIELGGRRLSLAGSRCSATGPCRFEMSKGRGGMDVVKCTHHNNSIIVMAYLVQSEKKHEYVVRNAKMVLTFVK